MLLKLLFIFGFGLVFGAKSYSDYKVYNVVPRSEDQVKLLVNLREQGYEFWSDVILVDRSVDIMVSPLEASTFLQLCESVNMSPVLRITNVQELINQQLQRKSEKRSAFGSLDWDDYHRLNEIYNWLDELEEMYPDVVTTVTIGYSNEGRPIRGVVINFNPEGRSERPLTGIIEGGIHAREWISPATMTWIIKEFLSSTDPDVRFMAETFVWHIFPVTNPDGYEYTFTDNRLWRKNRNPAHFTNCSSNNDLSNGIDLNRNFDFLWMTTGASQDPCQQTYAGPNGASEPETRAIANYVLELKQSANVVYYLAFHSYSQMILIPYSHASGFDVLEAENYADLYEIAIRGAEKLAERYGTQYAVGTSAEILYEVSGSSFDWVKGVADIPIVYLFELRDLGQSGFLLPPEQIIPNNEEIMDCLIEMDKTTRNLGYYYRSSSSINIGSLSLIISVIFLILLQ